MFGAGNSRKEVIAKTVAAAIAGAVPAALPFQAAGQQVAAFTQSECKGISSVVLQVVRTLGADSLSNDFKGSFRAWMGPNITCDGPTDIVVRTGRDSDALNTIYTLLESSSSRINLQTRAGLRAVRPTAGLGSG